MSTILIVDDRPTNRQFLLTLLGYTSHRLLEACDGAQALALVRAERPELIITDILMPTMDGYEFVQRVRADPELAPTRVIFFSATYAANETLAMAKSCGVRTVLPKPSDPQAIFDAVASELGVASPPAAAPYDAALRGAAPAAAPSPPRDDILTGELASTEQRIAALVKSRQADPALTKDLAALFIDKMSELHGIASRLTALEELSLRLIGERRADAMIAVFMQAASRILDVRYIGLALLDMSERKVDYCSAFGLEAGLLAPLGLDRAHLPGALLDQTRCVRLFAPGVTVDGLPDGHPPAATFLGMPIRDLNHLYGWIYFAGKNGTAPFSDEDERTGMTLATQLAVAYENMNLYQVVQRHAAQLQLEATARQQADAALRASEERFRAIIDSAPDAIIAADQDQRILHFNLAAHEMFGYSEDEVLGKPVTFLVPQRYHAMYNQRFERFRKRQQAARTSGRVVEMHGLRKDGEPVLFDLTLSVVKLQERSMFTAILRDSRQRRALEERLRLSAQVFDSTQESIMMTDAHANIVAVNPAFERITGYSEDEVQGMNPRLLRSGRHDATFYRAMWKSLQESGQWRGEIWNRRKNGQVYPERLSINAIREGSGKAMAYVSISSDISALKEAHLQLDFLSNHDALTLLPNRALLTDRLQQAIGVASQHGGRQLALLLFNIDRLQRINDSLGHEAGDLLLKEIAARVKKGAAPGDTLAHLGSDEFVLLLTQCADGDDIIAAARRLIDDISQPVHVAGRDLIVTASVGVSIYPRDGKSSAELLKAADVALSHMKETGRNGFRFFTGEMNAHALRWMSLESHLRRALERDELLLHFQPQVSLGDGRITGVEALVRWHSPALGLIAPSDFIPLAEDTGMILPIGDWVMRRACMQNKAWQDAGLAHMRVAVNVSAHQFMTGTLCDVVRAALAGSGLAPEFLEIELTESVMMGDSEATQLQLAELAAMGVSISLDDFGTGYSSLGYLSRYTLDKLKIDQTFVRNIITEPRSAAIAKATIALAHGLALQVTAEGVETEGQLNYLRSIGCDSVQGFLFSRPLPAEQMAALLQEGRTLAFEDGPAQPQRTLLLLDDEPNILAALKRLLRRDGYRILIAHSALEAFELLATNHVNVIVSDQRMPDMNGTEFLARASELYPDTIRMVLSGYTDLEAVTTAVNRGAIYKFLSKPWDDNSLRETIREAFRRYEREQERRGTN